MGDAQTRRPKVDPEALRQKYLAERDKRLRRDREAQYVEAKGDLARFVDDPHAGAPSPREPDREDVDVLIVGGGFAGLLTAARMRDLGISRLRIVEQGADFGGAWYWNRYPGVRCDIESYLYMPLLEEVGTIPSERYATGAEIFAHCQAIGRHYGLYERALFQTKVERLVWDEAAARWIVTTDRGDALRARFVCVGQGPLAKIKLPGIPGLRDFEGKAFHSSRWDYGYTGGDASGGMVGLRDKRVAVIGTGASAVQIAPHLAESAQHLFVMQRTPSAIAARGNRATDVEWFRSQPKGWQRRRMDNFLAVITGAPHDEDVVADGWTDFWIRFGALMRSGRYALAHDAMQAVDYEKMEEIRARVAELVEHPETAEAMKPWYNYLCKRPLYSDDFLQALNRPNVTLADTQGRGVERITAKGVVVDGREYPVDCIVFATGFDVGAAAHKVGGYEVVGRGGATLEQKWMQGLGTVHGTQAAGFPNFHIVGGVAQGTTAFNFTHTLDMQAVHAAELVALCLARRFRTLEVTLDAEARWRDELEARHVDHQAFYEQCTPGFLNNEGDFETRPTFVGGTYGAGPLAYETVITAWRRDHIGRDTRATLETEVSTKRLHANG